MKSNGLSKKERIHHRDLIRELWKGGDTIVERPIRLVYRLIDGTEGETVQIMTVAPKRRYKTAVQRNRIKRLLKEAYRINKHSLLDTAKSKGVSLNIMFIYNGREDVDFEFVQAKIILLLHRLESSLKAEE